MTLSLSPISSSLQPRKPGFQFGHCAFAAQENSDVRGRFRIHLFFDFAEGFLRHFDTTVEEPALLDCGKPMNELSTRADGFRRGVSYAGVQLEEPAVQGMLARCCNCKLLPFSSIRRLS